MIWEDVLCVLVADVSMVCSVFQFAKVHTFFHSAKTFLSHEAQTLSRRDKLAVLFRLPQTEDLWDP
jgi:hypothetical protein